MIFESDFISGLAEALGVDPASIGPSTKASDVEEWDSMGTMAIVLWLTDEFDIKLEPHDTVRLQSVESIMQLLREAGRIA